MIDETYDKFITIIYKWSERKKTHRSVGIYATRHGVYDEQEYYVLSIGVSTFLEADGYDPEKDWINDPKLNPDTEHNPKELIKWMCGSCMISIEDLKELSDELKAAGAPEVYIHPSYWTDNRSLLDHYKSDEWLIVIPKNQKL